MSQLDASDGPADAPNGDRGGVDVTPDQREVDQRGEVAVDLPVAEAGAPDLRNAAACPAAPPFGGGCAVDEAVECTYRSLCPDNNLPRDRLCTCTGGTWSCIQDLGCGLAEPAQETPPPQCQGSCSAAAPTCTYVVEKCAVAEDLEGRCSCSNGTWSCSRDFDCYPPNTCRQEGSHNCVTNGLVNTGTFCPPGTIQGPCTANPCALGEVERLRCARNSDGHRRHAACVYGQWACPIGYTLLIKLP